MASPVLIEEIPIDRNAEAHPEMRVDALSMPARVTLLGVELDCFTPDELIGHLVAASHAGIGGYVMTPNVDHLRLISRDPGLRERVTHASVRVADGMPLLWASRLQGTPLPARVAGSDLTGKLAAALAEADRTLYLLGGAPGTADRAAEILRQSNQGLRIVGTSCPPYGYDRDPQASAALLDAVVKEQPDFVYLGLPLEKSSALAMQLRESLPRTWFLGLGISLSFIAGDVTRAPRWMQIVGLEWLHRLWQEPKRLTKRYLLDDLPFAFRLFGSALLHRARGINDETAA